MLLPRHFFLHPIVDSFRRNWMSWTDGLDLQNFFDRGFCSKKPLSVVLLDLLQNFLVLQFQTLVL